MALSFSDFAALIEQGFNTVALTETLQLDRDTPVSIYQRFAGRGAFCLLESAALGDDTGRVGGGAAGDEGGIDRSGRPALPGDIVGDQTLTDLQIVFGDQHAGLQPGRRRGRDRAGGAGGHVPHHQGLGGIRGLLGTLQDDLVMDLTGMYRSKHRDVNQTIKVWIERCGYAIFMCRSMHKDVKL